MINTFIFMLIISGAQVEHHGNVNMISEDHKISMPIVVTVSGDINESSARAFAVSMEAAQETGQPVIPVVIDSFGGSVYALLSMIDVMQNSKVPVATIAVSKAMSAGAALLSCGTEGMRWAAPNVTIMIHEVSSATSGKVGEIKSDAKETVRLNDLMLQLMSKNIGKKPNYFSEEIHTKDHADWYLTAKDALKHNLVNHIGFPEFKMDITVETVFE